MDDIYRIRVSGHLGDRWSSCLGGFSVQRQGDGSTVLVGSVVDQAALHGVLASIRDLGLPLLSLNKIAGTYGCPAQERSIVTRPGYERRQGDKHEDGGKGTG